MIIAEKKAHIFLIPIGQIKSQKHKCSHLSRWLPGFHTEGSCWGSDLFISPVTRNKFIRSLRLCTLTHTHTHTHIQRQTFPYPPAPNSNIHYREKGWLRLSFSFLPGTYVRVGGGGGLPDPRAITAENPSVTYPHSSSSLLLCLTAWKKGKNTCSIYLFFYLFCLSVALRLVGSTVMFPLNAAALLIHRTVIWCVIPGWKTTKRTWQLWRWFRSRVQYSAVLPKPLKSPQFAQKTQECRSAHRFSRTGLQ